MAGGFDDDMEEVDGYIREGQDAAVDDVGALGSATWPALPLIPHLITKLEKQGHLPEHFRNVEDKYYLTELGTDLAKRNMPPADETPPNLMFLAGQALQTWAVQTPNDRPAHHSGSAP